MSQPVVTRFAPSPTGMLHIGGVRTALFCWLLARKYNGTFILRVEDTDLTRSTDDNIRIIEEGMAWVGLDWDEGPVPGDPNAFRGPHGPYRQMLRMDLYRAKIRQLLDRGLAYRCRCTREELDERRKEAETQGRPFLYDGRCRDRHWDDSVPAAIRLRMPREGEIVLRDLIKGDVAVPADSLDDWIIARMDGTPTYNFCVVVDDTDMGVTHVVRGDDHVSNTPKQIALYQALGYPLPAFAHVPMILGKDKQKLSKRHGAASITEFRDLGFLPAAVRLTLAKLSWTPKVDGKPAESVEEELLTDDEMVRWFDLADVQKSAAVFDLDKLTWVNQKLIQRLDWREIEPHLRWQFRLRGLEQAWLDRGEAWQALAIGCNKNRATLKEMAEHLAFLFEPPTRYDPAGVAKFLTPAIKPALREVAALQDYDHDALKAGFDRILERHGIKLKDLAQALRVAFTGRAVSPPIFDTLVLLGREAVAARLEPWLRADPEP
jgi:glutamyl-tRNA synthetase